MSVPVRTVDARTAPIVTPPIRSAGIVPSILYYMLGIYIKLPFPLDTQIARFILVEAYYHSMDSTLASPFIIEEESYISDSEPEKTAHDYFHEAKAQTDRDGFVTASIKGIDFELYRDYDSICSRFKICVRLPNQEFLTIKTRGDLGFPSLNMLTGHLFTDDTLPESIKLRKSENNQITVKDCRGNYYTTDESFTGITPTAGDAIARLKTKQDKNQRGFPVTITVSEESIIKNGSPYVELSTDLPYTDSITWELPIPPSVNLENPTTDLEKVLNAHGFESLSELDGETVFINYTKSLTQSCEKIRSTDSQWCFWMYDEPSTSWWKFWK